MKRVLLLCSVLLLIVLAACSDKEADEMIDYDVQVGQPSETTMTAIVLENTGVLFTVRDFKEHEAGKTYGSMHVGTADVRLLDESGNEVERDYFTEDMKIEIDYNGIIAESNPAQLGKTFEIREVVE